MLLSVGAVRALLEVLWRRQIVRRTSAEQNTVIDKLERLETLVYSLPLTGSWRSVFELVRAMGLDGGDSATTLARLGGAIAILLFTCQLLYMAKYGFYTWLVLQLEKKAARNANYGDTLRAGRRSVVSQRLSVYSERLTNRYSAIGLERMRTRTSYTCKRFANHAPYWQFVVWGRQFLLTVVTFIPGILAALGMAAEEEFIRGNADSLLSLQTTLSLAILVVAAVFHWRTKPFGFVFQNWLEMWLLTASIFLIALAAIYSATRGQSEGQVLEVALTTTLITSLLAAAVYLVIHYRTYLREVAARQALELEEALKRMRSSSSSFFRRQSSGALPVAQEASSSQPKRSRLTSVRFAPAAADSRVAGSVSARRQVGSTGPLQSAMRGSKARAAMRGSGFPTSTPGVRGSRASSGDRISIMIHPQGRQTWTGRGGTIIASMQEPSTKGEVTQPLPPERTPSMMASITAESAAAVPVPDAPMPADMEEMHDPDLRLSAAHSGMSAIASTSDESLGASDEAEEAHSRLFRMPPHSLSAISSASADLLPPSSGRDEHEDHERV